MPYNPSNFSQAQRGQLDYLFESLGIRELFERMDAIDGEGGPMEKVEENPTNDPAVQPNMEGVGTYSGGPNAENDGSMATHDPNLIKKIQQEAEEREAEDLETEYEEAETEDNNEDLKTDDSEIIDTDESKDEFEPVEEVQEHEDSSDSKYH